MSEAPTITVIIPTKNRSAFLHRSLRFFSKTAYPFPLIVADASDQTDARVRNEQAVHEADKAGLNVAYRAYPPTTRMYSKLADIVASATTPYVAICGDDDFLLPEGLRHAAEFLDSHHDYCIAHGRAVNVTVRGRGNIAVDFLQRSVEHASTEARLKDHLAQFSATLYSLHRTEALAKALHATTHSMREDHPQFWYRFCELLTSCLTIIYGKMKRLEVLYLVRQGHHDVGSVRARTLQWRDFFTHDDFSEHYQAFRSCLVGALVETGSTPTQALDIVNASFQAYMSNTLRQPAPFRDRVIFNMRNQWVRVLQEPKSLTERLLLEIRTPLWTVRRLLSPLRRQTKEIFATMRSLPRGVE